MRPIERRSAVLRADTIWLRGAISLASITPVASAELSGCVIVSGMPGSGKSTVSSLAASLIPRAAQIKGDDVNQMILSGRVWFMGEPRDEALR